MDGRAIPNIGSKSFTGPTTTIMSLTVSNYDWHDFFRNGTHNMGVVIAIWAPVMLEDTLVRINIAKFSQMWNEFISSLRNEDLISHRERDLLLVPYSSSDVSVVQWPPFLLARKIPIALDMAKDFKEKEDADLYRKVKNDDFMYTAVIECYQTLDGLF